LDCPDAAIGKIDLPRQGEETGTCPGIGRATARLRKSAADAFVCCGCDLDSLAGSGCRFGYDPEGCRTIASA
jgi:hypothetical protein